MKFLGRLARLLGYREMEIVAGRNAKSILFAPQGCSCVLLGEREKLSLGWDVLGDGLEAYGYETIRSRTPWVELARCRSCQRYWYVATDTTDDVVYMELLSPEAARLVVAENRWPTSFDRLTHVGLDANK